MGKMNKSSELIKLIAKITECAPAENPVCRNEYKKLFSLLKEDFYKELNESSYPQTPDADKSFSHLLADINTACTFYEITQKPLIIFAGECTNSLFLQLKSVLFNDGGLPCPQRPLTFPLSSNFWSALSWVPS